MDLQIIKLLDNILKIGRVKWRMAGGRRGWGGLGMGLAKYGDVIHPSGKALAAIPDCPERSLASEGGLGWIAFSGSDSKLFVLKRQNESG